MNKQVISLKESNLYAAGKLVITPNGNYLERDKYVYRASLNDRLHVVKAGELIDSLAAKYYSNLVDEADRYWWLIADANKVQDPLNLDLLIGKTLVIPDIFLARLERYG